jgi:hypothetical protein
VVALAIIVIGCVTAKLLKGLVFRFLLTVRFDVASDRVGIDDVLDRADIRHSPAELVAVLVYCSVLLGTLAAAVSALGLDQVSEVLTRCLVYAPKVAAAVVVLILGLFLASFLAGVVRTAAANAALAESHALAAFVRYAVVAFTAAGTLEEPGIEPELVRSSFSSARWHWRWPSGSGARTWHGNGWFDTSTAPGRVGSPTKGDA